jgi:DNA-binding MarR family transcriptional regulator
MRSLSPGTECGDSMKLSVKRIPPPMPKKIRQPKHQADPIVDERRMEFGPVKGHLAYYLRRLLKAFKYHFKSSVGDLDIQAHDVGALFAIGLNPGLTPSELVTTLYLDPAQVTGMLNTFELKGWIVRRVSSTDGRSRALHLTNAGQRLLAQLEPMVGEIDRAFVEGILTKEETAQLIGLLAKLHAGRRI